MVSFEAHVFNFHKSSLPIFVVFVLLSFVPKSQLSKCTVVKIYSYVFLSMFSGVGTLLRSWLYFVLVFP